MKGAVPGDVVTLSVSGQEYSATANRDGRVLFDAVMIKDSGTASFAATAGGATSSAELRVIPGWVSVLPAFLAIAIALSLRNVVPALLLGLWFGATALQSFTPTGAGKGLLDSFQVFVTGAVANEDRASIILFTMMIGGMVGIITRNGGMASIVKSIVSRAKTAVGGQVAVWLMGLMIFFDDYSNTLVVGNTARSLTDHLKISREKLAYIVDSTAAPVACLALITTVARQIAYQPKSGLICSATSTSRTAPENLKFFQDLPKGWHSKRVGVSHGHLQTGLNLVRALVRGRQAPPPVARDQGPARGERASSGPSTASPGMTSTAPRHGRARGRAHTGDRD